MFSIGVYSCVFLQVATGKAHSLFLTSEGQVLACGSNSAGQCGVGKGKDTITSPQLISYSGPNIIQVSTQCWQGKVHNHIPSADLIQWA
jgi:alpha-tubulin suppressor-like RCC1 family protein